MLTPVQDAVAGGPICSMTCTYTEDARYSTKEAWDACLEDVALLCATRRCAMVVVEARVAGYDGHLDVLLRCP